MALVSDTVFSLLMLASGAFAASTVGFAVLWLRARERAIRAEQRAGAPADLADPGDARLARIEQALDLVATDVERMEEGQRFLGQLLGERRAGERGAVRVATPR